MLAMLANHRVIRVASLSLGVRLGGYVATFVATILLTNILGSEEYGIYAYIFAIANTTALFSVLGSDTLLIRQLAVYVNKNKYEYARGIFVTVLCSTVLSSGFIIFLVLVFRATLIDKINLVCTGNLYSFIFLFPLLALLRLMLGVLRGLSLPVQAQFPDQIIRPIVFVTVILTTMWMSSFESTAVNSLLLQTIACLFALMVSATIVGKHRLFTDVVSGRKYELKDWSISSLTLAGTTVLQTIVAQFPLLFLGILGDAKSVAIYAVADRVGSTLNFSIIAANMALAGIIAKHNTNKAQLSKVAPLGARFATIISLPVAILFFVFASPVLSVFGEEFKDGTTLLRIIVCGYMFHILTGPVLVFLQMTYNEKYTLYISLIMFIFSLVSSYSLTKFYGELGAATAFVLSFAIYKLIMLWIVIRKVGVNPSVFGGILSFLHQKKRI